MASAKRLVQLAKKWQRMAEMGRKRLTLSKIAAMAKRATDDVCCTMSPVALKGHCVVYTNDGARLEVSLPYLGTAVFGELLRMSQEEFGFANGDGGSGRITLPCNTLVVEYAICLLRRSASKEVMKAFMSSVARPCRFDGGVVAPCIGLNNQQVAVC